VSHQRVMRCVEQLRREYTITTREEKRKEEILKMLRDLATSTERGRLGIPDFPKKKALW
jgi:hypothetical protein